MFLHVSEDEKRKVKTRATTELKKFVAIAAYLWILLSLFEIHRFVVLREFHLQSLSGYRLGFAAVNALIIGKAILIGEVFHLGERFSAKCVAFTTLFKSAVFAAFLVCFEIVEGVIVGLIHGKSVLASIPTLGGGGLEGMLLSGVMAFVVLIPLFLLMDMERVLGKDKLHSLIFQSRPRADAA